VAVGIGDSSEVVVVVVAKAGALVVGVDDAGDAVEVVDVADATLVEGVSAADGAAYGVSTQDDAAVERVCDAAEVIAVVAELGGFVAGVGCTRISQAEQTKQTPDEGIAGCLCDLPDFCSSTGHHD